MANIQHIPLAQLRISPRNARKTGGQAIDELAASIAAEGLLQNLVVTAANDGLYEVEAGGRRLRALQLLDQDGRLPEALAAVPCQVVPADVAGEASLAENTIREAMHPADQFEAFKALVDAGRSITEVAARFGVTEIFVRQRLRLARVRPEFLQMYRDDEMNLEQLQALATTDNHELQRQAWYSARDSWDRDARSLREFIMREKVPSNSRLARFVGIEAYRAAGGEVVQDLFSTQAWLADPALVDKLAMDKLEAEAEKLRAAGWSWAEPVLDLSYDVKAQYPQLPQPDDREYSDPAHAERIKAIDARLREIDAIDDSTLSAGEREDLYAEYDNLTIERDEIEDSARAVWPASIKAVAGVLLTVGHGGTLEICDGRLRPGQSVAKSGKIKGDPQAPSAADARTRKPDLSEAVRRTLSVHRSAAAAAQLAKDPTLAHCVLLEQMLNSHCLDRFGNNGLSLSLAGVNHLQDGSAEIHEALRAAIAARLQIIDQVPKKGTLQFLLQQTDAWRLELQAALVVAHFNGTTGSETGHEGVAAIHAVTGYNMADRWNPTTDDFLGRIHADLVAEAVIEARGKEAAAQLRGLKKADRVATAAKLLAGTGWLPKPLRGPSYGKKAAADVAKAEKPAKAAKPVKDKAPKKATKAAAKKKIAPTRKAGAKGAKKTSKKKATQA